MKVPHPGSGSRGAENSRISSQCVSGLLAAGLMLMNTLLQRAMQVSAQIQAGTLDRAYLDARQIEDAEARQLESWRGRASKDIEAREITGAFEAEKAG